MKRLEDIGISSISLGKDKNENVKFVQYEVNELIFGLNKSYLFKGEAESLKEALINHGVALKDDSSSASVCLKNKLREYIKLLNDYINAYVEDSNTVQKMISYTVARYVKNKKENSLTKKKILIFLDEYKRLKDNVTDTTNLNLTAFNDMQRELLTAIVQYYS